MSRVLLIGNNPPPFQQNTKVEAAHYRTWQFLQPLLDEGHEVCLCVDQSGYPPAAADLPKTLQWHSIPFEQVGWAHRLQATHDVFRPEAVVAVDFYSSLYTTKLRTSAPIWMDLYGDPLTIVQVARHRTETDQGIGTAIALMDHVLRRGDVFSACGVPQQHMLVGELAMCGRLNSRTFGYDFVRVVYPGAPSFPATDHGASDHRTRSSHGLDPESFVVLWCGGYNTWTDGATLYRALEWAMDRDPRVHFISVGASTYRAAETIYDQFVMAVKQSRHATRFHLLGWLPWAEIPGVYRASDVGISIDALHYETIYGTRTRLVEMMAYELPVITSLGCELSYIIRDKACGLSFPAGDWESLARAIVELAGDPAKLQAMRQAMRRMVSQDLSFKTTVTPLLAWLQAPRPAPDHSSPHLSTRAKALEYRMRTAVRLFLWRFGLSGRRA